MSLIFAAFFFAINSPMCSTLSRLALSALVWSAAFALYPKNTGERSSESHSAFFAGTLVLMASTPSSSSDVCSCKSYGSTAGFEDSSFCVLSTSSSSPAVATRCMAYPPADGCQPRRAREAESCSMALAASWALA